jgi:hypothetical protein
VGKLFEDEQSLVSDEDVDLGRALLAEIAERVGAENAQVRTDLQAVGAALEQARRVSTVEVLKQLTNRGPLPK